MAVDSNDALDVKTTFIGGGSRGWVPDVMRNLPLCPQVKGHHDRRSMAPPTAKPKRAPTAGAVGSALQNVFRAAGTRGGVVR